MVSCNLPLTGDPSTDTFSLVLCVEKAIEHSTVEKKLKKNLKNEITPWINGNLQKLIMYKKRLLNMRRKNPNDFNLQKRLKAISRVIKIAYRVSMNNYYEDNLREIQHNPKKSWKFLNESLGRTVNNSIKLKNADGDAIVEDSEKAEVLNKYFIESVHDLRSQIEHYPEDTCNLLRTLIQHNDRFQIDFVTSEEITNVILNLKQGKSPGHDNVSAKVLLNCNNIITPFLVDIFNSMVVRGTYPDILKIHKVVPIPKGKNVTDVNMFRPIAILSIIDNVFERILHTQISNYMQSQNLLNEFQYGFRKGCGTEEATVNVVNFICKSLDEGYKGVAGIFYDFTKAFDLIDHKILIQKLRYYGICGRELSLLRSYLTNRKQFVQINSQKSTSRDVEHGVPQGSVLGPLLFTIFLNDLKNLCLSGKLFMYADDICLFYPYRHETAVKVYMERDAALISEFARINKLVLNAKKTKLLRFKPSSQQNEGFSVFVDGNVVTEQKSITYLGVILQSNLNWSQHIQHTKAKISQAIGFLYKFKNKFSKDTKFLIYNALIQSHLNYLAILYGYKKSTELKLLQRSQNKALKIVANLPVLHPTFSLYHDIFPSVLPIYGLYKLQLLLYVFKCLHNIGHHTVQFSRNQQSFNTRNNSNLAVARCRLETTRQRVEHMGSRLFNSLPSSLKCILRISTFKNSVKNYLFEQLEELLT